jgi:hypothetical protein
MTFDLNACARRDRLLAVDTYSFVQSEPDPRGRIAGCKVGTPFRVWYTPSGVIVRADIELPESYSASSERSVETIVQELEQRPDSRWKDMDPGKKAEMIRKAAKLRQEISDRRGPRIRF